MVSANPCVILDSFPTILVPIKDKDFKIFRNVAQCTRTISNMDNKTIVKSGQRKKPGEFANIVPALVPQANHIRTGFHSFLAVPLLSGPGLCD